MTLSYSVRRGARSLDRRCREGVREEGGREGGGREGGRREGGREGGREGKTEGGREGREEGKEGGGRKGEKEEDRREEKGMKMGTCHDAQSSTPYIWMVLPLVRQPSS